MTVTRQLFRALNPALQVVSTSARAPFKQTDSGLIWLSRFGGRFGHMDVSEAFTVSHFYRGVKLIATTIAARPIEIFDEDRATKTETQVYTPEERFLWEKPNPEVASVIFWETVIGHEVSTGNAYMYVVTDQLGRPVELWPVEPTRVKVGRTKAGRKVYEIDGDKVDVDYSVGGNIVHVPGFGFNGLVGLSPVQLGALSFNLSKEAEEYAGGFFEEGATPGGVLHSDQELTTDEAEDYAKRWEKSHKGQRNQHKVAVLGKGLKWQSVSVNPADAQLLETRKFSVAEGSRWLGVPPHMLFDAERQAAWRGIEEEGRNFVTYTVDEHETRFEQTISNELIISRPNRRFRWDDTGLTRGKLRDQVEAARALVLAGYEPQDVLRVVGLPPMSHLGLPPTTLQKLNEALGEVVDDDEEDGG